MSISLKTCTKCGEQKPWSEYHKHKIGKDGLMSRCKACTKLVASSYYDSHREELLAKGKSYRDANPEKTYARKRRWYEQNRERSAATTAAWAQANSDKKLASVRNRRAKLRQVEGSHTAEDVRLQLELQHYRCYWCGIKLEVTGRNKFHVDHRHPIFLGGSNGPENIVCACRACNCSKQEKTPLEFAGRLF